MNLVFSGSSSTEIEFKVNIAGTASAPQRVSAVLEQDGISLSFPAKLDGEMWKSCISNVGNVFKAGVANFSINVVLNDKLFIPMVGPALIEMPDSVQVSITPTVAVAVAQENPQPEVQIATAEQVAPTETEKQIESSAPIKDEPVSPKIDEQPVTIEHEEVTKHQPAAQKFALLRSIEPVKKTKSVQESTVSKTPKVVLAPKASSFKLKRVKIVTEQ